MRALLRCALLTLCLYSTPAAADAPALAPVTLRNAGELSLTAPNGKDYRLFISLPTEAPPPEGWPVIYVLDGNAWFPQFSAQAIMMGRRPDHNGLLPAIIVGIGYPGDRDFYMDRRVPDFTPNAPEREAPPEGWEAPGGADRFLDFIESRVKPLILGNYKANPRNQSIFGHSLGGLLVLHAYFTRPNAYANYAAVSSSIWWNREYIREEEARFVSTLSKAPPSGRLILAVGAAELPDMVQGSEDMATRLSPLAAKGLKFDFLKIEGEDHITVPLPAFTRLIRNTLQASAADREHYRKLQEAPAQ